jgi:hypothetical protein
MVKVFGGLAFLWFLLLVGSVVLAILILVTFFGMYFKLASIERLLKQDQERKPILSTSETSLVEKPEEETASLQGKYDELSEKIENAKSRAEKAELWKERLKIKTEMEHLNSQLVNVREISKKMEK